MDFLLRNLFKIRATDHREIQEEIRRNLRSLGYYVELEKRIKQLTAEPKEPETFREPKG